MENLQTLKIILVHETVSLKLSCQNYDWSSCDLGIFKNVSFFPNSVKLHMVLFYECRDMRFWNAMKENISILMYPFRKGISKYTVFSSCRESTRTIKIIIVIVFSSMKYMLLICHGSSVLLRLTLLIVENKNTFNKDTIIFVWQK